MTNPQIYVETYGCTASYADSEMIMGVLKQAGCRIVEDQTQADLNMIVTCTVKTPTFQRMIHRIKHASSQGKPLVVAGCMPKTELETLERIAPQASLLGPSSVGKAAEAIEATLGGKRVTFVNGLRQEKVLLPKIRRNPVVGIVEVGSGCVSACTFCQVKIAKGGLLSYRPGAIVQEVTEAVKEGCREIWLTSTDNGCYGRDIHGDLAELLELVCNVEGGFRVRVGMMNPTHLPRILDRLVETFLHEKVFKFIHIPVQSGSDRILRLMARGHTVEKFKEVVEVFRRAIPNLTLSTDIIVGFPTEDEGDFQATLKLLEEIKPDVVNISKYGARTGTKAALMPQVDPRVINERSRTIHTLVRRLSHEANKKWVGWRGDVLVDEYGDPGSVGRNFAYKPVVIKSKVPLGSTFPVEVVDASSACLRGRLAS